jgi:putative ABC transport system permease protein
MRGYRERLRRLTLLPHPAVLATPLRLTRFPPVLAAILGASFILGVTAAAPVFFVASAGNAALHDELSVAGSSEGSADLEVTLYGHVDRVAFQRANQALLRETSAIDALGDPAITAIGTPLDLRSDTGTEEARVRLIHRTGALGHIERLRGTGGSGVWVPHTLARPLRLSPGDNNTLQSGDRRIATRTAGIYRDLASDQLSDYWEPITFEIINPITTDVQPPPLLIVNERTFFDLGASLDDDAEYTWRFPLNASNITLPEAERVTAALLSLSNRARDPTSRLRKGFKRLSGERFGPGVESPLLSLVPNAEQTIASLEASIGFIALVGQIVALASIATAGVFGVRRRATEVRLLLSQGVAPLQQGSRFAAEAVLPAALGALAGWAVASWLSRALGPSPLVTRGVGGAAGQSVLLWTIAGVVVVAVVAALFIRQQSRLASGTGTRLVTGAPWEAAILVLAAASLYEILSGRSAFVDEVGADVRPELFVLAFPILLFTGVAGLAARGLRRVLPRLRKSTGPRFVSLYLASRRLAAASPTALLVTGVSAVAVALLVYAGTLVSSMETTVDAKAHVAIGSDVAVSVPRTAAVPQDDELSITRVTRGSGTLFPGELPVDLLGIDPSTFPQAAFWDERFSDSSLGDLLERLEGDGDRLPVIVAGMASPQRRGAFADSSLEIPLSIVGEASTFPGMSFARPLLVADQEALTRMVAEEKDGIFSSSEELWVEGDSGRIEGFLEANQLDVYAVRTVEEITEQAGLKSITWTFGFLRALGVMAGFLVLIAMALYLQAEQRRREIAYGLARRMGLGRAAHGVAMVVELGGMLAASLISGVALALACAAALLGRLDPLPDLPPSPLFDSPSSLLLLLPPIALLACLTAGWAAQRTADRANVAEVMRLAD